MNNKDFISYIKEHLNKSNEQPQTQEFEKEYMQETGGYIGVATTFLSKGRLGRREDKEFYNWICRNRPKIIEDIDIDYLLEKGEVSVNQKWHFFISWYAYKEFCSLKNTNEDWIANSVYSRKSGILQYWVTCPELFLWIYEVVVGKIDEELIKEAIDYRKGLVTRKKWAEKLKYAKENIVSRIEEELKKSI